MTSFSIRTMLAAIGFLAVGMSAMLWPNLIWVTILAVASMVGCFALIAVGIGAQGKFRLQAISFLTIFFLFCYVISNPKLTITQVNDMLTNSIASSMGTSEPKKSKSGEWVFKGKEEEYTLYRKGGWIEIDKAAVEKAGLEPFIYTRLSSVSSDNFKAICKYIFAFVLGVFGYTLTGIVYDKRPKHETESIEN